MQELLARYLLHWTPERAIWLGGQTLSWDARCAGIYAGFGIALLVQLIWHCHVKKLPPWSLMATTAAFCLPLFIDVATVRYGLRPPVNTIKHLTGVWFGSAFCCLLYPAVSHLTTSNRHSAPFSLRSLAILMAVATAISSLANWDRPLSYYLLESLAWFGFSGLAILAASGIILIIKPAAGKAEPGDTNPTRRSPPPDADAT